jgi:hypothetical protein
MQSCTFTNRDQETAMTTPTLKINGLWTQFINPLRKREPFQTGGSMHGDRGAGSLGRLPAQYHASARLADYTVWSYATPIAWHVPGAGWVMPDERYSGTTAKQQGRIRTALSVIDAPACDSEQARDPDRDPGPALDPVVFGPSA